MLKLFSLIIAVIGISLGLYGIYGLITEGVGIFVFGPTIYLFGGLVVGILFLLLYIRLNKK